ncbi:hypothetical protein HID58_080510 [Brassica napus]|uniref:Histidine kinase/HSP90-like ATPase domain-containing protein n=1 Tax=Brassica napus TaxID=3708 RepID=A0ABQ7Y541_BRANA|nr:hypothetical protein HID58_080510 [Brassica napus]
MRKRAIVSVLFLFSLLFLLPDQGRKLHANAEDSSDEVTDPPKVEKKLGGHGGLSTDSDVVQESESISKKSLRSSGEKFEFQAEVSRLMDIIINSLYSNKDIFLRELISNASDALDKIRFLALTDKDVLGEGDTAKLEIQIKLDKAKKILSIRDRGIGMTKEDLIKNLGTIAQSGTSGIGDLNLIGQFGVGFYSAYLVADYIEVISKHSDDNQHVWESKADGKFTVSEDTWNEPLGRGTEIRLHLRDDAGGYLEGSKLKDLVKRYSEFINFPIHLWASKEVETEVPVEEDESAEEESETTSTEEEKEEDAEEEDSEKKQKTKKVKETVHEWELLNDVKAMWLRSPKEVTDEEYTKFYHSLAKDFSEEKPTAWSHFNAEGDVEFKAVLYVPPKAAHDQYESYYNSNKANLKLFVRRVFISDEFDELLPKYLSFLKGLVDSDTLPLNVSREMLQQHSSLKTIKKNLIRKTLDMIRKLAEEDPDEVHDDDKKVQWKIDFPGSVIFFTDPVDEYLMQYLMDYEDKKFQNVSKEGLKVGKDSKVKELKEAFKDLTKWWKESLAGENVDDVKISNRLADTLCVVVTSKFGWSANMERIMQSQTLSDAKKQAYMRGKRVLEINLRHPIIKELKDRVASDPEDGSVKETAQLMYQTALIESGFILNDPKDFAGRIYNSVKSSLKISPDAVPEEEVEAEETETSEEDEIRWWSEH